MVFLTKVQNYIKIEFVNYFIYEENPDLIKSLIQTKKLENINNFEEEEEQPHRNENSIGDSYRKHLEVGIFENNPEKEQRLVGFNSFTNINKNEFSPRKKLEVENINLLTRLALYYFDPLKNYF